MTTIVIDLDGTLCNCDHRVHLAQAQQWDEFHKGLLADEPYNDVADLVRTLSRTQIIIAVTGRNAAFKELTWRWFQLHALDEAITDVIMRPDGDWRPDHELKPMMLEEHFGSKEKVLEGVGFVLDDREKVVEAWRNYGLPCWQVRPGGY